MKYPHPSVLVSTLLYYIFLHCIYILHNNTQSYHTALRAIMYRISLQTTQKQITHTHTQTRTHIYYTHMRTHTHSRTPTHPFTIPHLDDTDQLQTTHSLGKLQFFCGEFLHCSLSVCSNHLTDLLVSSYEKASKWLMNIPHMCNFHHQCVRDI